MTAPKIGVKNISSINDNLKFKQRKNVRILNNAGEAKTEAKIRSKVGIRISEHGKIPKNQIFFEKLEAKTLVETLEKLLLNLSDKMTKRRKNDKAQCIVYFENKSYKKSKQP